MLKSYESAWVRLTCWSLTDPDRLEWMWHRSSTETGIALMNCWWCSSHTYEDSDNSKSVNEPFSIRATLYFPFRFIKNLPHCPTIRATNTNWMCCTQRTMCLSLTAYKKKWCLCLKLSVARIGQTLRWLYTYWSSGLLVGLQCAAFFTHPRSRLIIIHSNCNQTLLRDHSHYRSVWQGEDNLTLTLTLEGNTHANNGTCFTYKHV
jgi:hypothetical protein